MPSPTTRGDGSVNGAAIPVAAIGKVNVTDPWGTAWGMDSPYDASVAYASNPNRITMRQSAYFGSGLALASLAGGGSGAPSPTTVGGMTASASGTPTLHPNHHTASSSPAPSSFSSISGSASQSTNVWSEASSTNSALSSFQGVTPPSAPWMTKDSSNGSSSKRRSVSFQGDLSQFGNNGQPSPTYSAQSEGLPSTIPLQTPPSMPNLRARSTTHLPSLLHHRPQSQHHHLHYNNHHHHSGMMGNHRHSGLPPMNRRTLSTPGTEADRSAFRKSFIGGSVVTQPGLSADLPPVPMDPKVLAKMSKKGGAGGGQSGVASSRASIMTNATDRTDALSTMSGFEGGNKKASKRKSWFARSPSSLAVETSSASTISTSATSVSSASRSNTRQSSESSHYSNGGKSAPSLSRAGSSFNTMHSSSPPPPTPPIPDTLPLPPSSLGDKSRKSSTASLRQRVHAASGQSASPAPGSDSKAGNASSVPATPHSGSRLKTPPTPSIYGTPLASPSNAPNTVTQNNGILSSAPISSSPLSMSPMTSPTSASFIPLKPAALARPAALQLATHEEHSMLPDSFPSPGTHHDSLRRAEVEGMLGPEAKKDVMPFVPVQPVSMSLPPTPMTEVTPVNMPAVDGNENALAPAAVIKPSPSSPPALGSLAAMANPRQERTTSKSPTATPSSTHSSRQRASPNPGNSNFSRPTSPVEPQQHQLHASVSTIQAVNTTPRTSSRTGMNRAEEPGSAKTNTLASPPSSIPSRKTSNNSLRATLRQAPPSPQPSSAIVEHVSNNMDQFLPSGPGAPVQFDHQHGQQLEIPPPPIAVQAQQPAAVPHQPDLKTSLSSFAVRTAFPDHTAPAGDMALVPPMPRKSSNQSIHPEAVPLPDSPALGGNGFENAQQTQTEMQMPLQPRGLAAPQAQSMPGDVSGQARQRESSRVRDPTECLALTFFFLVVKPRASSPNLRGPAAPQSKIAASKGAQPSQVGKGAAGTPARKASKSPFSLFKRSRSKTLGDGSPNPSEAAAAQLHAPPPPMPTARKASLPYDSALPAASPALSAQMTPAATPQLSFSSSTTSTIAGSEPSDQFYADFAPASRPSFTKNDSSSSSSGNNTITSSSNNNHLKKSAASQRNNHHQQQQHINAKQPLKESHSSKGTFSRMFGASTKRKV